MKKKISKSLVISIVILVLVVVAAGFTMFKITTTVGDLKTTISGHTADAILASAGVPDESAVSVPILYYDQKMDECVNLYDKNSKEALSKRQFEWAKCGYHNKSLETGLVDFYLDDAYLPVAKGGELLANRGVKGDNFKRWFSQVEGLSMSYAGTIDLNYSASEVKFGYENERFYPLDEVEFSKGDAVNSDGHNHLFTLNLGIPFRTLASGEEMFEITADDDTFVFLGNELVLDMGGVHDAMRGKFIIQENGEVYTGVNGEELAYSGVVAEKGTDLIIRIFHADRDADSSVFKLALTKMKLNMTNTKIAAGDEEGLQIAYDSTNPSYVAPLGESETSMPDRSNAVLSSLIIQCLILGVILVFSVVVIRVVMKQMRR